MAEKPKNPQFSHKEIEPGTSVQIKFKDGKPFKSGKSQYGQWYGYNIYKDKVEHTWFVDTEWFEIFESIELSKGSEVLISSVFYNIHKDGKPIPSSYFVVNYKGNEYEIGKKEGEVKKPEKKEEQPIGDKRYTEGIRDKLDNLDELYEESTRFVLAMLEGIYNDRDKDHAINLTPDASVRMINTLFMAKAKVI